jgi:hypothetical protein
MLQRVHQAAHPRRRDRQRPALVLPGRGQIQVQAQVKLALPAGKTTRRDRFQRRQLTLIMR